MGKSKKKDKEKDERKSKKSRKGKPIKKSKNEKKAGKKRKAETSSSSSSSSSSSDDFSQAELAEAVKIAETFGVTLGFAKSFFWCFLQLLFCLNSVCVNVRKEKQLQFGKNITKISDLSTAHLCVALAKTIGDLTEQALFQCGGELVEAVSSEMHLKHNKCQERSYSSYYFVVRIVLKRTERGKLEKGKVGEDCSKTLMTLMTKPAQYFACC